MDLSVNVLQWSLQGKSLIKTNMSVYVTLFLNYSHKSTWAPPLQRAPEKTELQPNACADKTLAMCFLFDWGHRSRSNSVIVSIIIESSSIATWKGERSIDCSCTVIVFPQSKMHGILNGEHASAVCRGRPYTQGRERMITLCWAAGRENNAERWLTMTLLTNDCGALLGSRMNYLFLWLVLFNSCFIIVAGEKRGKRFLHSASSSESTVVPHFAPCSDWPQTHSSTLHGRKRVCMVSLPFPNLTTHDTILGRIICLSCQGG